MAGPVLNIHDANGFPMAPEGATKIGATIAPIGRALGMTGLGCMYVQVEPGKRAFPFHNHLGNDEMFVILEGTGTYRFGEGEHPVKAGDVCAAPRGGPNTAHQIINTGGIPLKYMGISTSNDPDVCEYPDSGKFSAIAIAPGQDFFSAHLNYVGRRDTAVDYFGVEDT
ncbi:MAG: cupin domain-containing protein [Pseudomonadota bacterium]